MLRHAIVAVALLFSVAVAQPAVATSDIGPQRIANVECQPLSSLATPADQSSNPPATPVAPPLVDGTNAIEEHELPPGPDADAETVETLFSLERQYAACLNAGDYGALLSFFDASMVESVQEALDSPGTPIAPAVEVLIDSVALRCVRTYPGGYAAALLDWKVEGGVETNVRIYRDSGSGWIIAGEVSTYGQQGTGCDGLMAIQRISTHRIGTGPSINLRREPSREATIVRALPPGTPLAFLGLETPNDIPQDESRWMEFMTADGDAGWIRESNVEDGAR